MTVQFINQHADLLDFCQKIASSQWLAIDTEFLREKTYYPQLCLIQIATTDHIACIDPLALDDLTPLLDLIYDPNMTSVFHAGRQDLELFYMLKGKLPQSIFDTQLAATVLGYGEQIGYGNLVKQCLNIDLDKAHSRTDWTKRPLDPAQIDYAADDVRYLRDVYLLLLQQLAEKNRRHWLNEDFASLTQIETYQPDINNIWRKIKGAGRLKGVQLAILQKLAAWREQRAITSNRPRRWVLKDELLIDLAKLGPDTTEQFAMIRGLESGTIQRHGQSLLEQIKLAKALPKEQWPIIKKPQPLTTQQDAIVDALLALLRKLCDEQAISPVAVATRKDIEKLVHGEQTIPLLHGWRNDVVGHHLKQFIDGKLSISADKTQLYIHQQG